MIPTFLHSLATQVRALVASGKALHVTNQTADELELLAGLDWMLSAPLVEMSEVAVRPIRPADIAWAWLKLSRAQCGRFIYDHGGPGEHLASEGAVVRAAECAELVAVAARLMPEVRPILPEMTEATQAQVCKMLEDFGSGAIAIRPIEMQVVGIHPHDGTREGARAAWGHVAEKLRSGQEFPRHGIGFHAREDGKPGLGIRMSASEAREFAEMLSRHSDRYRRELEAM